MADDLPVAQLTLFRNEGLRSKWLVFKVPLERDWVISETSFFSGSQLHSSTDNQSHNNKNNTEMQND